MDLLNNLVYTALNETSASGGVSTTTTTAFPSLLPDFFDLPAAIQSLGANPKPFVRGANFFAYNINIVQQFCAIDDPEFIEDAIQKHWADMVTGRNYIGALEPANPTPNMSIIVQSFRQNAAAPLIPPYHLIYAYLVENTRIAQIFEKLLYMYMHDEKLNKATGPLSSQNQLAFQWMVNTETLFFKNLKNTSYRNINSQLRPLQDATRRNAYFRLFGMDLAFGDVSTNAAVSYNKAEFNNQHFITLFEKFLAEVWQAYTNASNTSGANTTDLFIIVDTAQKLQEMLMSRRTTESSFENYRYFNLSKEEYASVVMMAWLFEVISYDSPIVEFLRCNGGTPGERLINIGNKIGLPAHSKSEGLLDIAPVMNTLLRRIELGDYNAQEEVNRIIRSQSQVPPAGVEEHHRKALDNLLLIINNWEKATGHRIKTPQPVTNGIARVQQNGGAKPQPVLN